MSQNASNACAPSTPPSYLPPTVRSTVMSDSASSMPTPFHPQVHETLKNFTHSPAIAIKVMDCKMVQRCHSAYAHGQNIVPEHLRRSLELVIERAALGRLYLALGNPASPQRKPYRNDSARDQRHIANRVAGITLQCFPITPAEHDGSAHDHKDEQRDPSESQPTARHPFGTPNRLYALGTMSANANVTL